MVVTLVSLDSRPNPSIVIIFRHCEQRCDFNFFLLQVKNHRDISVIVVVDLVKDVLAGKN